MLEDRLQPGLFDAPSESPERRIALDAQSWLELVPGFVEGPAELFEHLRATLDWKQRDRILWEQVVTEPRLTAEVHDLSLTAHAALRDVAQRLSARYGVGYDSVWVNFYRDGRDSTAWHRDAISCWREDCVVPVLTLGASRRFLIKPRPGGASRALWPESGDVLAMGGRCQRDWLHAVPKDPKVRRPRISVNFMSSEQGRVTSRARRPS